VIDGWTWKYWSHGQARAVRAPGGAMSATIRDPFPSDRIRSTAPMQAIRPAARAGIPRGLLRVSIATAVLMIGMVLLLCLTWPGGGGLQS
jgi:hypothetical protein